MLRLSCLMVLFFLVIYSCSPGVTMSPEEMLSYSKRTKLPTQKDFPDEGAVILYENETQRFFISESGKPNIEQSFHRALLYFNDKAEDWTTPSIYLDPDYTLLNFFARTIKPNGEIINLSRDDLVSTQLKEDFVSFSDNESVKFTFPAVEPYAILEYSYKVNIYDDFYAGDIWTIQQSIPKLYSRFTVGIPNNFFDYFDWTYLPVNITIGKPQRQRLLQNVYWEVRDIPAIKYEPDMPAYSDVAQYVRIDLKYKDWDELAGYYWSSIKEMFDPAEKEQIKKLAIEICNGSVTEEEKIQRIYEYTQKKFRYIASDIGESGYIPNTPEEILLNKYGDCKDMTVLNSVLLKSLDIEAFPALIKTRDQGKINPRIVSIRPFNHMINYVKTKNGQEYWLDATGSNCPLGEMYPSVEGVTALVIYKDGKSEFKAIPASKAEDNKVIRIVDLFINEDGSANGSAQIRFTGNENLSFRTYFRSASKKDMLNTVESYVNANTADIKIDSLEYDNPADISEAFTLKFNFSKTEFGSQVSDLLIFKPNLFTLDPQLDRYRDEERNYALEFHSPYKISDIVNIHYDPRKYSVKSSGKIFNERKKHTKFIILARKISDGLISYKRTYSLNMTRIPKNLYTEFRDVKKVIAQANDDNIVLQVKK